MLPMTTTCNRLARTKNKRLRTCKRGDYSVREGEDGTYTQSTRTSFNSSAFPRDPPVRRSRAGCGAGSRGRCGNFVCAGRGRACARTPARTCHLGRRSLFSVRARRRRACSYYTTCRTLDEGPRIPSCNKYQPGWAAKGDEGEG